jgi:uncharacterized protein (TIRG00374 family)
MMRRLGARSVLAWSGVAVSLVFVYVAVRGVDFAVFWSALAEGDYWLLIPAAIVLGSALYLRAIRWRILFVRESRPPLDAVTSALLIGYLFNSVLPARAGEAARVVALNQRARTSRFEALATVVAERVLDVLVLLGLLLASAPFIPESTWMQRAAKVGGAAFIVLAVTLIVVAFYGKRPVRLVLRPLGALPRVTPEHIERAADNLVRGLAVFRRPGLALGASALTLASWLLIALSFWLCMVAVRLDAGLDAALLVVIAVNLAMILPSGPAGLGVFEAVTVLTLLPFGVDRAHALSYAIVVHALNLVPIIAAGYIALHRHAVAVRRLRRSDGSDSPSSAVRTTGSGRMSS